MKTSSKLLSIALLALALGFVSCKKDTVNADDFLSEIVEEEETITLSKAGFKTNSIGLIKATTDNYYEAGTMEYIVNGVLEATFEFQTGGQGSLNKNGSSTIKSLKGKSKKTKKYTKVIVSPMVKVSGCQWIVQGIIEYYDDKNNLLATIDFGNGLCDEWATKTFPNNNKPPVTFSQDDWFKK
jgi:hypothetical protein